MRKVQLAIFFFLFLITGCLKQHSIESECIVAAIRENNMIIYKDQDLGCKFYLSLYQFQNRPYFVLDNPCADIIPNPIDCEGNQICLDMENPICKSFFINSKWIRIIGIEK